MDALSTARSSLVDMDSMGNPDTSSINNALPSGTRLKDFELVSPLGQGGFSIVYAAMDTALQRPVAVKEYMPSSFASRADSSQVILRSQRHKSSFDAGLNSFIEEARLLAQFKHPALVEVLSFWEENGTAYMVMPLYSGKTLRQTLRDHPGCANEIWLKGLIAPVLDVLELLHEQQIYHRDIAPDNIIIKLDGLPVLLDLGSARKVVTDSEHSPTVVVKPGYAPIEQYAEDKSVPQGPWTDIYALGALLYYAVTGRAPSASVSRMMKDSLALLGDQQLPGYSKGFLAAIDFALALQPGDRPQSIREFRDALELNDLSMSRAAMAKALPAEPAPEYLDEEKTVILSAADLEQLLHGGKEAHIQASDGDYEDLFSAQVKPKADAHSFADMDEFLNPPTPQSIGRVSVPVGHKVPAAAATPTPPNNIARNTRLLWAAAIAVGTLAFTMLIAAVLIEMTGDQAASETAFSSPSEAQSPAETPEPSNDNPLLIADQTDAGADLGFLYDVPPRPETLVLDAPQFNAEAADTLQEPLRSLVTSQDTPSVEPASSNEASVQAEAQDNTRAAAVTEPAVVPPTVTARPPEPVNTRTPAAPPVARVERSNTSAPVATGQIELNILPWGEVWVDGTLMGVTPPLRELQLPVGQRSIEIRNPGFSSLTHSIEIKADTKPLIEHEFLSDGSTRNLNAPDRTEQRATDVQANRTPAVQPRSAAQPARTASAASTQYGYADIRVSPWAEVWVNGEMKGIAPPLNELRLPEGVHTIEFRNPNVPNARQTVTISSTSRTTLVQSFD